MLARKNSQSKAPASSSLLKCISLIACFARETESAAAPIRSIGEFVVQKCANPSCSARFQRLRDGRLFVVQAEENRNSKQLRYFWLCTDCCRTLTVVAGKGNEVTVAPLAFRRATS
jgi:hypothetical protein